MWMKLLKKSYSSVEEHVSENTVPVLVIPTLYMLTYVIAWELLLKVTPTLHCRRHLINMSYVSILVI